VRAEEEMTDLNGMSAAELEDLLADLQADLEDVEEERAFVLGQTGMHISASTVARYESERESLRARIEQAEEALRARRMEEG
jgi:hypothetical protein